VVVHFDEVPSVSSARNFPELRDRKHDAILTRIRSLQVDEALADDLKTEILFDDQLVIATGAQSKWARRRKIDLAELVHEPWIMQAGHTWNHQRLTEAFQARGLDLPKASLITLSMPIITHFLAKGQCIAAIPRSVVQLNSLKVLAVDLPARAWPVAIVTLKHRTQSPVVERFVECAREVAKSVIGRPATPARRRNSKGMRRRG
jgi:DNA-binding transcriptional LysR family regulator